MKVALAVNAALVLFGTGCGTEDGSSSSSLTRTPGECGDVETHVVGVYEVPDPEESVILRVDRPGKHALVLSAHQGANWKVSAGPGVEIVEIYAVGLAKQTVSAPKGVPIITESDEQGGPWACGYSWPGGEGCDTKSLLRLASIRTQRHATSFHGCYAATRWTIGEDMSVTSDCGTEPQSDIITRCAPELDESDCDGVVY